MLYSIFGLLRYSYTGGKFGHTYRGLLFRKVAYTRYDLPWLLYTIQWGVMKCMQLHDSFHLQGTVCTYKSNFNFNWDHDNQKKSTRPATVMIRYYYYHRYGLKAGWQRNRGSIPGRRMRFSLLHSVQTGTGTQPASYPMGTGGSFPGGKVAGAWSWPLTFIYCRGQEWWAKPPLPQTSTWRVA
jgi:hypothetical protein